MTTKSTEHRAGCLAQKHFISGFWSTPWAVVSREYRDAVGRKRKGVSRVWLRWRCNDTECPAELLVLEDHVLSLVQPRKP